MDLIALLKLKEWFLKEQRDLPWRRSPTPYHVWVSEVMLQQTQVSVVVPYYIRWMEKFPTIQALSDTPIEEVLKVWEGLGYYSRARNLHQAARYLVKEHAGVIPSEREALMKIKGIGPYTVGAILSFAFHQKAAAVDGNVNRVLCRFYLIDEPITKIQVKLREMVEKLLPNEEPWILMEGFIELGAKICQKKPQCSQCPLQLSCLGAFSEKALALPNRGKKIIYQNIVKKAAVLIYKGEILVKKGVKGEVMADLYEFPTFANIDEFRLTLEHIKDLAPIKYSYTRYRATLMPSVWRVEKKKEIENSIWISIEEARNLPFSSGHRRLFKNLVF